MHRYRVTSWQVFRQNSLNSQFQLAFVLPLTEKLQTAEQALKLAQVYAVSHPLGGKMLAVAPLLNNERWPYNDWLQARDHEAGVRQTVKLTESEKAERNLDTY